MSIHSLSNRRISDMVTNWFHKRNNVGISPSTVVNIVHNKFVMFCTSKQLNISVSTEQLKESISEATCVMYYAKRANKGWEGPHRMVSYPAVWSNEYEELWIDCLDKYIFTPEYWTRFWSTLPTEVCETDIPYWRENMEAILPQYILRESEILKRFGLVAEMTKQIGSANDKSTDQEEEYYEDY